jgi:hypothetical protein
LDKQDKRDIAQAVFAQDRDGRLTERIEELRALTFEREGEDKGTAAENATNLELARAALMDEWLENEDSDFTIKDRPVVAMGVAMTLTEYDILTTLLRVYDHSRSHFVFEICDESVRRFLNATRIRFEEDGDRMPWLVYRATILERMQNSSIIDGLLSYVIKPRENGCPIGLWVAERLAERRLLNDDGIEMLAERRLLNDDGIEMSEDTWLELVLSFLTNEEKQTLQVPAREKRKAYDENRGYTVLSLQDTLARFDPMTFRKFKQGFCQDPVAVRVIHLASFATSKKEDAAAKVPKWKEKKNESSSARENHKGELESHAAGKDKPVTATFDNKASLPEKNGRPDQEVYAKFKKEGLRRRIWDSIVAGRCARCDGVHLRVACPKPRAKWEDDIENDSFFLPRSGSEKKKSHKQARVQLSRGLNVVDSRVLYVESAQGRCLVDTCSDVTVARLDVLVGVRSVEPVVVNHLGGETTLNRAGELTLGGRSSSVAAELSEVLGVEHNELPAGVIALLGMGEVRWLGLSLDFIASNPGCSWELEVHPARARSDPSIWRRVVSCFRRRPAVPLHEPARAPQGLPSNPPPPLPVFNGENGAHVNEEEQSPLLPEDRRPWRGPTTPSAARRRFEIEEERFQRRRYERLLEELKGRDGRLLLLRTKEKAKEELRQRTFNKMEGLRSRSDKRRPAADYGHSSGSSTPLPASVPEEERLRILTDLRLRAKALKFYAVRRGRVPGVYYTWPDCEANVKGVSNEYKSFKSYGAAVEWYNGGRPASSPKLEIWTTELRGIPSTSFVSGTGLRALADVYQDGHQQTTSVVCGLDSMSDVTMALAEFLHDVHDIETESLSTTGSSATFNREGTLKLLVNAEIVEIPSLVATAAQLPNLRHPVGCPRIGCPRRPVGRASQEATYPSCMPCGRKNVTSLVGDARGKER